MKNKEPSVRSALMISVISGVGGFINGVWVVLAGTSYFNRLSPYALIFRAIFRVVPSQFVEDAHYFLFRSGVQFVLAPLLGALLGAVVGWVASRFGEKPATSFLVKTGAITSGIGGFVSLGTSF